MNKIGITHDRVTYGPNATMISLITPWTTEQESILVRTHWAGYNEWVAQIAQKRHMSFEQVDGLGRGRVWTGTQAAANGLVDTVGTLDDAIRIAARMAGAADSASVSETHYPKTQTFWEAVSSGDFGLARAILAQSMFRDAIAPFEDAYITTRSWYSAPELAVTAENGR
jgi:protease-4